jgi:phosphatidylserine/phosphatidylglycerophosphate/cardiolipin synthase-like enzyme
MRPAATRPPLRRTAKITLVADRAHYDEVILRLVTQARVSLWIGTANLKDLHVEASVGTAARARGRYVSILQTFEALAARGVELRILHGALPSRPFREALAKRRALARGALAMRHCPRVHLKVIAVDGRALYLGSANFTGAGLGAKGEGRRNFEMGILTDDEGMLDAAQERFEQIWSGKECGGCKLRAVCPRPLDLPPPAPGVRPRARTG